MIKLKVLGKFENINTSWRDISVSDFLKIISIKTDVDEIEFISLVSGVKYSTIEKLSVESRNVILYFISFVEDIEDLECFNVNSKYISIGSESWGKLEKAKQALSKYENAIHATPEIIKIYYSADILTSKITDEFGRMNFILKELNIFFERFKRLGEHEESPEEAIAGVDRFQQFGFMASCIELSRKMGISYDEVLKKSANEIYMTFLYDFEKSDYEKKLFDVKNRLK